MKSTSETDVDSRLHPVGQKGRRTQPQEGRPVEDQRLEYPPLPRPRDLAYVEEGSDDDGHSATMNADCSTPHFDALLVLKIAIMAQRQVALFVSGR